MSRKTKAKIKKDARELAIILTNLFLIIGIVPMMAILPEGFPVIISIIILTIDITYLYDRQSETK